MRIFRKLANSSDPDSMAVRLRRRRFKHFRTLMSNLPRPTSVLDVGGTQRFWENMGFIDESGIRIHILNLYPIETSHPNVESVIGDATHLDDYEDDQFDVVFSNSVIEHVGGMPEQHAMAREVMRVGKRYFVQTPNRYFPIEPHFLFPLFQFLPLSVRVFLIQHFAIGWTGKITDRAQAVRRAKAIRLLTKAELIDCFPGAKLDRERVFGLIKSYTAYSGWS